jgi:plastocyanin
MQRRGSVVIAVLVAGVLVGCGGGGDEGDTGGATEAAGNATEATTGGADAGGQTLNFVSADIEYTSAPSAASSGEATVVLDNQGQLEHYVVIDELGLEVEAEGGESAEGSVALEPGTYTYYCKVPGHREAGMEGELTVS